MSGCYVVLPIKNKQIIIRNKESRSKILELILKSPGIRYRQLLRLTGLSNGSLSFALKKLEKSKDIIVNRSSNNRATGYYPKILRLQNSILYLISEMKLKKELCKSY